MGELRPKWHRDIATQATFKDYIDMFWNDWSDNYLKFGDLLKY